MNKLTSLRLRHSNLGVYGDPAGSVWITAATPQLQSGGLAIRLAVASFFSSAVIGGGFGGGGTQR